MPNEVMFLFLQTLTNKSLAMAFWGLGRHRYENNETLCNGLLAEEEEAFAYLSNKVLPTIIKMAINRHLSKEVGQDIAQDSILRFILRIREGRYIYEGHSPATFVITTANFLMLNLIRRNPDTGNPEDTNKDIPDKDFIEIFEYKDSAKVLEQIILNKLGETCRNLIWSKYIDELKDAEVIEKGLTGYKSVQSLRNARSECLRKLNELLTKTKSRGK